MRYAIVILLMAVPASAAEPVQPPQQRVVVPQPKPVIVTQPSSTRPLRGPLRNRIATSMADIMVGTTEKMFEEMPKAIANSVVDSVKRGDYKLTINGSGQPEIQIGQTAPAQVVPIQPAPTQPVPVPQRRGLFRR